MKLIRWCLPIVFILLLAAAWIWLNRPQKADMADYAPADALVYLESNSLLDIAEGILHTDAWKGLSPSFGAIGARWPNRWLRNLIFLTGIGPTQTVILSRAQVAAVMLELGATEETETLTIKPEGAILFETHTGERRIRSTVEEALRRFAEKAYQQPTMAKRNVAGAEFMVWSVPTSGRQIVATIDGSLVIVGNSERAVRTCLEVHRGQRPNLRNDQEMQRMRRQLAADAALTFGFISSSNTARLLSTGVPLLFGRAPGEIQFSRIIATAASRISEGVGWSSRAYMGGIEDRYIFSLQPSLVSRLRPFFRATDQAVQPLKILPDNFYSATAYKFENPAAAWQMFGTAVSAELDTLSAVVFNSILRSALTPYGIEDPERFLGIVGPQLITARLKRDSEQSVLIAQVRDESALRGFLLGHLGRNPTKTPIAGAELIEFPGNTITCVFLNGNIVIGQAEDVKSCILAAHERQTLDKKDTFKRIEHFLSLSNSAAIVTYTDDRLRVLDFFLAIARANDSSPVTKQSPELQRGIEELPYSATQTSLIDQGLERRTLSSLGQFATLLPLLFPDR